jgi:hypothetical protein
MKKTDICHHCNVDYIPTRRGIQKFCSNSCRSRFWYLKQNFESRESKVKDHPKVVEQKSKDDKMTWSGVGNAFTGAAAVEVAKNIFTPLEKKPATKKDIQELKAFIKGRYLPIKNAEKDVYGRFPYYDVVTGNVVYLKLDKLSMDWSNSNSLP